MRTKKTIINSIISILMYSINIIIGFIFQKIFIMTLGNEYLGLNGLFTNILSILAVVELGFGNAIIYHLYKPLAEKNEKEINLLIKFYKKTYNLIAAIIFLLGIVSMLFLKNIIGEVNIEENVYLLYFIALFDIVASYLLTYKRSILYANQETYIVNIVHIGYIFILNLTGIILLILTKNYIFYLILKVIFRILENIIITIVVNKKYPFLLRKEDDMLSKEVEKDIYEKVKGLLFHKIGGSIIYGTDNIIISKIFGVITVGLYSNYYLIINSVQSLLYQIFSSITSSVGNLLLEDNEDKSYKIYKNMLFINSWLFGFCGICILCLTEPFIKIWIGTEYILPFNVLIVLVTNFYIQGMRRTSNTFKEAAGIFYEDRFVPIIESIINIIASIVFAKIFGLVGVFLGTITSSLILFLYSYPVLVFKKLFNKSYLEFIKLHLKFLLITVVVAIASFYIVSIVSMRNQFVELLLKMIGCFIVPNILFIILFFRIDEFEYYKSFIKKILIKFLKN